MKQLWEYIKKPKTNLVCEWQEEQEWKITTRFGNRSSVRYRKLKFIYLYMCHITSFSFSHSISLPPSPLNFWSSQIRNVIVSNMPWLHGKWLTDSWLKVKCFKKTFTFWTEQSWMNLTVSGYTMCTYFWLYAYLYWIFINLQQSTSLFNIVNLRMTYRIWRAWYSIGW